MGNEWLGGLGKENARECDIWTFNPQYEASLAKECTVLPLRKGAFVVAEINAKGAKGPHSSYVVATVTDEDEDFIQLLYFDPLYSEFFSSGVPRSTIRQEIKDNKKKR